MSEINTIPCRKCHGKGRVTLPESLAETLRLVDARKGSHAVELAALTPHTNSMAHNNRLAELMELGFLTRQREGKFLRYFRVKRNGRAAK